MESTIKNNLYLKVITPDGIKYGEYINIATIETVSDGFEGFLVNHLPMVSEITIGQMRITDLDNKKRIAAVAGGFLYNDGKELKILTPYFEFLDLVDRKKIEQKIEKLQANLATEKNENKIRTLKITLKNENNKLLAIDNNLA